MIQDAGRKMAFQTYKDPEIYQLSHELAIKIHKITISLIASYENMKKNWDGKSTTSSKLWNPVVKPNPVSCILDLASQGQNDKRAGGG